MENNDINDYLQEFLDERSAQNLADETLRMYSVHVNLFLSLLHITNVSQINSKSFQQFITALKADRKIKDVSVASYCRSIRAFLYWLMENEYIDTFKVHIPRYQTSIKRCYTDDELKLLLKRPRMHCSETEYISWVFTNLICATGIRLRSARNIRVQDIQNDWLYLERTKNKQGLRLYLNPDLQRILKRYIDAFALQSTDYLFCTAQKEQYTTHTLDKMINQYNTDRGVTQTGIHRMRHTFARNFYIQTKDVYALSKLLGHSSVAVTENYLRDLGMETFFSDVNYNPQQQFSQVEKRRWGRMQ